MGSLLEGRPLYPHLKLTRLEFPRVLATRVLREDGDEYFGPFPNKTGVRLLMGFVHRTFRLRSCEIDIDGNFPVPCTQYFSKRCLAPCVSEICDKNSYLEVVEAVRLFLRNDREGFLTHSQEKISAASDELEFERAAAWRDRLIAAEDFWSHPRQPWVGDAVDTYTVAGTEGETIVQLVTTRGRHMVGSLNISFFADHFVPDLLSEFIEEYYRFHMPREIRVPVAISRRAQVADTLEQRFGRRATISVVRTSPTVTAERGFNKMGRDETLRQLGPRTFVTDLGQWKTLGIDREPAVIEAYDAAHISATSFSAGASVWKRGRVAPEDFEGWVSDQDNEPATLAAFAAKRLAEGKGDHPDLVLVDGGLGQMRAVRKAVTGTEDRRFRLVGAVKPRGKHSQISHFLTESEDRVEFDPTKKAHVLLQRLRDEAHDIANAAHRELREMRDFYAASGHEPLVVPIGFVERGGAADDLRPIEPR
jgi:excinuclease ABC subunit C